MRKLRSIRIEGDVAYVPLTRGYEAIIDAVDVPLVSGNNWSAQPSKKTTYAICKKSQGGRRVTVRMHRVLCDDFGPIDHKDGNGLNNRRRGEFCNLRSATGSENAMNRGLRADNTSGFKGVIWRKDRAKWQGYINANGRRTNLGFFQCRTAAAFAYAKASQMLHGEFARPNFGEVT